MWCWNCFLAIGDITPCSLLPNIVLCNISDLSSENTIQIYKNSNIIKNLIARNYSGKCGDCSYKFQCGGCRVRGLKLNFDIMESYLLESVNNFVYLLSLNY